MSYFDEFDPTPDEEYLEDAEIKTLTKEKDAWKTMYLELRNRVAGA